MTTNQVPAARAEKETPLGWGILSAAYLTCSSFCPTDSPRPPLANLHPAVGMFRLGTINVSVARVAPSYELIELSTGLGSGGSCGSQTMVQGFGGLKFHATISVQRKELPASLSDINGW